MANPGRQFGFRNLNGAAFQIEILSGSRGNIIPDLNAIDRLTSQTINIMNKHGKKAERIARSRNHSPFWKGPLIRSIRWNDAKSGEVAGRVIRGYLEVGVPYGRRQEFEHSTKSRYLQRAMDAVFPDFVEEMRSKRVVGDILFGRTRQASSGSGDMRFGSTSGGFFRG